jgi:hypothetical protein
MESMSTSTFHLGFRGSELRRIAIPMLIAAAGALAISIGAAAGPIQAAIPGATHCVPGTSHPCSQTVTRPDALGAPAPLTRPVILSAPQATSPISASDKAKLPALRARISAAMGLPASH